jgi:hypothetical protein
MVGTDGDRQTAAARVREKETVVDRQRHGLISLTRTEIQNSMLDGIEKFIQRIQRHLLL